MQDVCVAAGWGYLARGARAHGVVLKSLRSGRWF